MDFNTIGALIYFGVAIVVAIISATIMRVKRDYWMKFGFVDAFISSLFGAMWPLAIVAEVVYLASDFLYSKFFKAKEN